MLRLDPMTEPEFQEYLATAVSDYAQAHIKAGDVDPAVAMELAQKDYDSLLPHGLASDNQHLLTARDESDAAVGMVWFATRDLRTGGKGAFIYDVHVNEGLRGRGLGRQVMEALERQARQLDVRRIDLNVFGYNTAARGLYEKMGYGVTGVGMIKWLR